jgi:hypothetical protein
VVAQLAQQLAQTKQQAEQAHQGCETNWFFSSFANFQTEKSPALRGFS